MKQKAANGVDSESPSRWTAIGIVARSRLSRSSIGVNRSDRAEANPESAARQARDGFVDYFTAADRQVWYRPELKAKVAYRDVTREGLLRHASFKDLLKT